MYVYVLKKWHFYNTYTLKQYKLKSSSFLYSDQAGEFETAYYVLSYLLTSFVGLGSIGFRAKENYRFALSQMAL